MLQVRRGALRITRRFSCAAAVPVRIRVLRIELDGTVQVFDGALVFAKLEVRITTRVVSQRVIRLHFDGFRQLGHGSPEFLRLQQLATLLMMLLRGGGCGGRWGGLWNR